MNRTLAILAVLLLLCSSAFAAPHLVATVVSGTATCAATIDGTAQASFAASGTTCSYDLATNTPALTVGSHTATMTASTASDPVWGTQTSAPSSPFTFTKPATEATPTGLTLTP